MKKIVFCFLFSLPFIAYTQCNTSNATGCDCLDGSDDCDLLPDITASYDLLLEGDETVEEPGLLKLSVGTPNIGHGPLRVLPTDYFVCGTDTIYSPGGLDACPDGSAPHQIIKQRIYHKSGSTMSYTEKNAGTMTYHPTHGHFHTDNWGIYTLRKPVDGETDPTLWPVIGYGTKMGFCLMDLANCASPSSYGYCRDMAGDVVTSDAPNYGLGGGDFDCDINNQGISCGYMDIYDYYLDGMFIEIPDGVCNGDYYIVVQIDPNLNYDEEHDDNNMIAVPITLTDQPESTDFFPITAASGLILCSGATIDLSVSPVGTSYAWSNGATTSTITVSEPGTYYCNITRECGPGYSDTVTVSTLEVEAPVAEATVDVCEGTAGTLTATADGMIGWYDAETGGTLLATGPSFETPVLYADAMYYTDNYSSVEMSGEGNVGEAEHEGTDYSGFGSPYNGYQTFDVMTDITLESVKVFTEYPGVRTIELRNASDDVLQSKTIDIGSGTTVIDLDFDITSGTGYRLGTNGDQNDETFGDLAPRLKRSDEGTTYPYNLGDAISITGTSYDGTRWYYFYDWKVAYTNTYSCNSIRVPVQAKVVECVGISEVAGLDDLTIYPNPTNGTFTVSYKDITNQNAVINIVNNLGEMVSSENVSGDHPEKTFNLSGLAAGAYTVEIVSGNRSIHRQIIIE